MAEVDLHLHTTFSDGRLTPNELIHLVASRGLKVVAITDHDSTESIVPSLEAAREFPQLTVIPGIELSTDIPGNEIHLLGYFIDYEDADFQRTLLRFRKTREERARKMVEKLASMGVHISWDRVVELSDGGAIGRPHIAQAMVERGYITYPQDAFPRYIGRNAPAYVEREKLTPSDAVRLVVGVGGLPVLAHPGDVSDLDQMAPELKEAGLVGMEVYYGKYPPRQVAELELMAKNLALIPCGGSDYHAFGTPGEAEPGSVGPPLQTFEALMALYQERQHAQYSHR